ncbi:putative Seryl-tRNA synthetase [Cutaneotrichosporon oleaginosum]|uniref:serine--tRNA ligase n=1 Tax=Cutaneotrichosporon oleaginosum TaxID=879819 RepID=A0A0J0XVX1_9TREE|nr:putative Seryl-tRNA synthetase [Cutaneotrichosporon oleaginosum]KLT45183.1 putative Seryl-tRNA synthetase [Cutaneotrichosporon oleaginosum]
MSLTLSGRALCPRVSLSGVRSSTGFTRHLKRLRRDGASPEILAATIGQVPEPQPITGRRRSVPSPIPRGRLDYARLLSDPEATKRNVTERGLPFAEEHVEDLRDARAYALDVEQRLNSARAEHGAISSLFRDQHKKRDKKQAIADARALKERVHALEREAREADDELFALASTLPNFTHADAPRGAEDAAVEIERFGPPPARADDARDHVEIARRFGWLDTAASALATGASWPYLRGTFAQLEHALVGYAVSKAMAAGYEVVSPPDVVMADMAARCGFQPRDGEDGPRQTYYIEQEEGSGEPTLCLAGTAEVPLASMFANQVLYAAGLPARVVGVGRAFRAEAGARGADTRGLYRVHQFTKVELFNVTRPEESEAAMEDMLVLQKDIARSLGLSVRVLDMPTQELGASASRKYDMEAYMPGRGKWGEITSTSNCTDYQSRRLLIRYRDGDAGLRFPHTLNGTAAAVPRLIVALVENGARMRGGEVVGVDLPAVLRPFWVGPEALADGNGEGEGVVRFV